MDISRRRFLVLSALTAGSSLVPVGCAEPNPPPTGPEKVAGTIKRSDFPETELDLTNVVEAYFGDAKPANVRQLGKRYLKRFGDDTEAVADDLSRVVTTIGDATEMQTALETLDRTVVEDFESARLADVGGWQLAGAESQLAGHYYLWTKG